MGKTKCGSRKNGISIDSFNYECLIVNQHEDSIVVGPKDGAYVKGFYLEGARWDFEHDCFIEAVRKEVYLLSNANDPFEAS